MSSGSFLEAKKLFKRENKKGKRKNELREMNKRTGEKERYREGQKKGI